MHGDHEAPPEQMIEADKEINANLALALFNRYLEPLELWGARPNTLDIGCAYPWLAHSLYRLGCRAHGMEPGKQVEQWCSELNVKHEPCDFDDAEHNAILLGEEFHLITMVHVFEHMYDPLAALNKLRSLIHDDGVVYLRMPAHDVAGFERDLTEGHYTIHPFFHCYDSVMEAIVQTGLFTVESTYAVPPGCRDFILRPIIGE